MTDPTEPTGFITPTKPKRALDTDTKRAMFFVGGGLVAFHIFGIILWIATGYASAFGGAVAADVVLGVVSLLWLGAVRLFPEEGR